MSEKQVNIGIKRIKEIGYQINEEILTEANTEINLTFGLTTNFDIGQKTTEIVLSATYFKKDTNETMLEIKTSNIFTILELEDFKNKDNSFSLPENILVTLLSLSITHTRALLSKNTQGTKYADLYIPIVNPTILLQGLIKEK